MKILVTGGAGYIGSVLVPYLLNDPNFEVTVLDNLMWNQFPFGGLFHDSRFEFIKGDARDESVLADCLKSVDVVIPLAALVGAPLCNLDKIGAKTTNSGAILTLIKNMSSEQLLIIPITNSGYGIGAPGQECTEESPLKPLSLYGETKVMAEAIAFDHFNTVSLRLATVFGMSPRMRLDLLVNDFVWRAVHDKALVLFEADFKRNYIHVRDVAATFGYVIRNSEKMVGEKYNVGLSDANLSKRELCERIKEQIPGFTFLEAPVGEDPDKRDYIVSNAKLEATGWRPHRTLNEGIAELIKGYSMMHKTVYGNV